jgi:hypothetical protein
MAEKTIRVCDVDGVPATHTVRIQDGRANWLKDLCDKDFAALVQGARKPPRGRRPGTKVATHKSSAKSANGRRRKVAARRKS